MCVIYIHAIHEDLHVFICMYVRYCVKINIYRHVCVCFVYTCVLYIYILIPRCCGFVSTHTSLPNGLLSCLVSCQVALCDTGVAQDHGGEP